MMLSSSGSSINLSSQRIADLHCDLLYYLAYDPKRTPFDPCVRCSYPQLKEGGVAIQALAISSVTEPDSSKKGWAQAEMYRQLLHTYPDHFVSFRKLDSSNHDRIAIVPAVENMSSLCSEEDDLAAQLKRFAEFYKRAGGILYASLTWNMENRFGGGALTNIGLKDDGKIVVDFLAEHAIALDLSHASDRLAHDLFDYIDKRGLNIHVLASHSNLRHVVDVPRNLPDAIAKEIIKRNGIIGLNFIRYFTGNTSVDVGRQLQHLLMLGGAKHACLGADFFYPSDFPTGKRDEDIFFPDLDNASCYPHLISILEKKWSLPKDLLQDLSYNNFVSFLVRV